MRLGDFDVPMVLANPVADTLRSADTQRYLEAAGRRTVRGIVHGAIYKPPPGPGAHPGLDRVLSAVTDPFVRGARAEALPWVIGILGGAFIMGYAAGRR